MAKMKLKVPVQKGKIEISKPVPSKMESQKEKLSERKAQMKGVKSGEIMKKCCKK